MTEIRALQHFLYCPHRRGLLYHENLRKDNVFTVKADLLHERVHSGETLGRTKGKLTFSSLSVYSETYGIYGKTDALELFPDPDGVEIEGFDGRYRILLIEYKPTASKNGTRAEDRLQLFAQAVCVREIFSCEPKSYCYYGDTKRRENVRFDESDEKLLRDTLAEMQLWKENGKLPPADYGKKCNGCSLKDDCLPKSRASRAEERIRKELLCENY